MKPTQKSKPQRQADLPDLITLSHKFPIILYDGVCHLCHNSVSWIIQKDTRSVFKYMPLQWVSGLQEMNSVILLSGGRIYSQSEATVQILKILGGPYKYLSVVLNVIPSAVSDAVYHFIARRRYRWFGKYDSCEMVDDTYYDWWNHRTE
jgi:predicted DCC family thiol-disulfide oxidoreductase YuxK